MSVINTRVLGHHIPGGMFTNMVAQLKEANALNRLPEVYAEPPRTRKEFGYPPLVTPTSQIVGIQAVQNVLFGRYKMISREVKDYVYGLYGKAPASIDPEVQKIVLKGYERGDRPITCRAADILPPELDKAKEATKDIARDIGDMLIYALYPTTGMKFLRWKYGLEAPPPDVAQSVSVVTPTAKVAEKELPPATATVAEGETELQAPMPGLIISFSVKVGDWVDAGDTVAILEAIKMENALPAPCSGRVKAIRFKPGDKVSTGQTIAIIA